MAAEEGGGAGEVGGAGPEEEEGAGVLRAGAGIQVTLLHDKLSKDPYAQFLEVCITFTCFFFKLIINK